jgi:hypothetical protein
MPSTGWEIMRGGRSLVPTLGKGHTLNDWKVPRSITRALIARSSFAAGIASICGSLNWHIKASACGISKTKGLMRQMRDGRFKGGKDETDFQT